MNSSAARDLHHFEWDYPKNVIRMTGHRASKYMMSCSARRNGLQVDPS